jgi:hypothetical protein
MILEAMSTPVECEKAWAGPADLPNLAADRPEVQLAYLLKLPKWLVDPVTGVTTADRQFTYDQLVSRGVHRGARQGIGESGSRVFNPRRRQMLWTIFVILLVLWLLGVVTSYTLGGFIHVLLVVAVVLAIMQLLQGRRAL